mmetsp:Transcript_37654/g.104816  ORF Transcript_37654/g.104816 Transcript_37654/m.104816 type:complete len:209 (+) Transcript_37654:1258-1884(+)
MCRHWRPWVQQCQCGSGPSGVCHRRAERQRWCLRCEAGRPCLHGERTEPGAVGAAVCHRCRGTHARAAWRWPPRNRGGGQRRRCPHRPASIGNGDGGALPRPWRRRERCHGNARARDRRRGAATRHRRGRGGGHAAGASGRGGRRPGRRLRLHGDGPHRRGRHQHTARRGRAGPRPERRERRARGRAAQWRSRHQDAARPRGRPDATA